MVKHVSHLTTVHLDILLFSSSHYSHLVVVILILKPYNYYV